MELMQASPITVAIISFTLFFTIMYWFYVLPFVKAKRVSFITVMAAAITLTLCLFAVIDRLKPLGGLIILAFWIVPSAYIYKNRADFSGLDQKPLIGLQIFRLIGALFILEMARGHIPPSFALSAGIGDILVGILAAFLFLFYEMIPRKGALILICLGILDFVMAFSFGFLSLPGPFQVFAVDFDNQVNLFPTGMIPIFLVPYALVFHVLSFINLPREVK